MGDAAMTVGDEQLDALAAEYIMGWRYMKAPNGWRDSYNATPAEPVMFVDEWTPTTDIAQAWMLVEKMHADGFYFELGWFPGDIASVYFGNPPWLFGPSMNESASRAIVMAALRAVDVGVTE